MIGRSESERAEVIARSRARMLRATAEHERAAAVIDEMDAMLEDAWTRAVASSALAPAVLGAMVRCDRLANEHLAECLRRDPRWTLGAAALVAQLTDAQVDALDAQAPAPWSQALRSAMVWAERTPARDPDWSELLQAGWSALEVMLAPGPARNAATAAIDTALANDEPTALDLSETLTMLCALAEDDARRARLPELIERFEATIATDPDAQQRSFALRASCGHIARAYLAIGDIRAAISVADRIERETIAGEDDAIACVRLVLRACRAHVTAEERAVLDRRIAESLSRDAPIDQWLNEAAVRELDEDEHQRLVARVRAAIEASGAEPWIVGGVENVPRECIDAWAEQLVRAEPRPLPGSSVARTLSVLCGRGSRVAKDFIERTTRQRSVPWWSAIELFQHLPIDTLNVVLDAALAEHPVRWPTTTRAALRWVSADVSNSCASMIDRVLAHEPPEQQVQRALGALGRVFERGARWLRDGGARDAEHDRVAASVARGKLAASPAFDRVWWELGEAAQRSAWMARPTRADQAGAIPNARVIESLAGAHARESYVALVERAVRSIARSVGAQQGP